MDKINSKIKAYVKYAVESAQDRINLAHKTTDVVLELDRLGVEANYISEKTGKFILSAGKYNIVIQASKDKIVYLLFDFETKQKLATTSDFEEFKKQLSKIK